MSFLNKKHVPAFSNTNSGKSLNHPSKSQASYNDSHNSETLHQKTTHPNLLGGYSNLQNSPKKAGHPQIPLPLNPQNIQSRSSYCSLVSSQQQQCPIHQSQPLKHLCVQCNQLLCAQCISDHLQMHRQKANEIPKIQSIKKMKINMQQKLNRVLQFMESNNPKQLVSDFQQLTQDIVNKVNHIRNDLITLVNDFTDQLQHSLLFQFVQVQSMTNLSQQMYALKDQILLLSHTLLNQKEMVGQVVKKVSKLDDQKLQAGYLEMFNKFSKLVLKTKLSFNCDFVSIKKSLNNLITIKQLYSQNPVAIIHKTQIQTGKDSQIKKLEQIQSMSSIMEESDIKVKQDIVPVQQPNFIKKKQTVQIIQIVEQSNQVIKQIHREGSTKRLQIFGKKQQVHQQQVEQN